MSTVVSPISTANGRQTVPDVVLHNGARLTVVVRQMPARHMLEKYMHLALVGQEAQILDNVCTHVPGENPLPDKWVDDLTPESHARLLEVAAALNFTLGLAMLERMKASQARVAPAEATKK